MILNGNSKVRLNIPVLFKKVTINVTSNYPINCYIVEQKKLKNPSVDLVNDSLCFQLSAYKYQQILAGSQIAYCLILVNKGINAANVKINVNISYIS